MTKNLTISIPDDLKAEMDKYHEVNWDEVARNAIKSYIKIRQAHDKIYIDFMGDLFTEADKNW